MTQPYSESLRRLAVAGRSCSGEAEWRAVMIIRMGKSGARGNRDILAA